jgi:glucose-1-phosphate adenylyltransferase
MPLTADRAKPAVPFGGSYRLIDFVLSNLVNAEMRKIAVLTQYKSHSLDRHITTTWRMSTLLGNYITPVPAQQRLGPRWYTGSADAILQNFNLIQDENPNHVLVFGADHVYRMDPSQMFEQHLETGAGITIAAIRMKRSEAHDFSVSSNLQMMELRSRHFTKSLPTHLQCQVIPISAWSRWVTTSSSAMLWKKL